MVAFLTALSGCLHGPELRVWENSSPLLSDLPSFSYKIQDLACVEGIISMEAQCLKNILAAVRRFKTSSDPDWTWKPFPVLVMDWGRGKKKKKRNPGSFWGALGLYLNFVILALPCVTQLFFLYSEWCVMYSMDVYVYFHLQLTILAWIS